MGLRICWEFDRSFCQILFSPGCHGTISKWVIIKWVWEEGGLNWGFRVWKWADLLMAV